MFEIHATVTTNNTRQFEMDCLEIGCKPIIIELENQTTMVDRQIMTSQQFAHFDYAKETIAITTNLKKYGYEVNRIKVEIHPDYVNSFDKEIKYLESHLRVITSPELLDILKEKASGNGWYPSRNLLKKEGNVIHQMLTLRTPDTNVQQFKENVSKFIMMLINGGFYVNKMEIEGCIVDTNEDLDKNWLV